MDPFIVLPDTKTSFELRSDLAEAGAPVLLSFSRGKDSVACWLALRDQGVEVIPYHLYLVPGLEFVARDLARWEDFFGQRIIDLPHPSLYRWLRNAVFQAPERLAIIEAAQLPRFSYDDLVGEIRRRYASEDSWVCDGVRAADSPARRLSFITHGVTSVPRRKVSAVWDWRKSHVMGRIAEAGVALSPEYEWFGRSFDGLDARFTGPLREHAPDDYDRLIEWFPLADLDLTAVRRG